MDYRVVECDFIERTLKIIEQYDELVMPSKPEKEQLEVSLLINCLTGLLVLPYEHQKRVQGVSTPNMCSDGKTAIRDLSEDWGLSRIEIATFVYEGRQIQKEDTTLNQTVAMIRHSIAHGKFGDGNTTRKPNGVSIQYSDLAKNTNSSKEEDLQSKIEKVNFVNIYGNTYFEATISVADLKIFSKKLANAVLGDIGCNSKQLL